MNLNQQQLLPLTVIMWVEILFPLETIWEVFPHLWLQKYQDKLTSDNLKFKYKFMSEWQSKTTAAFQRTKHFLSAKKEISFY